MRLRDTAYSLALVVLTSGCTTVSLTSTLVDEGDAGTSGISYALPIGMVELLITKESEEITIAQPKVSYLPDPYNRYNITIDENPWYSEHPVVKTNKAGLLSNVNGDSTDAGPAIVESVVSLVTNTGTLADGNILTTASKATTPKKLQKRLVFDPLDPAQLLKARTELGNLPIRVHVLDIGGNSLHQLNHGSAVIKRKSKQLKEDAKVSAKSCNSSVCFRLTVPLILRVSVGSLSIQDFSILVPNPRLVAGIDINRAPCVHTTTKLELTEGVLTSYDKNLPSTILGCLAIPSTIVKGILGFPIALNERRVALLDAEAKLLNKQTAVIEAQQKLIAAQQKTNGN